MSFWSVTLGDEPVVHSKAPASWRELYECEWPVPDGIPRDALGISGDPPPRAGATGGLIPTPMWTLGQEMVWDRNRVRIMAEALGVEYDEVDNFILEQWRP